MKTVLSVFLASILTATAQLFYKLGAKELATSHFSGYVVLGICIYALASVLILFALRSGNVSVVFPMLSVTFIWVSLLAVLVLGEELRLIQWAGICSIVIGVGLIGAQHD